MSNTQGEYNTELQTKIRASLKRHPEKPLVRAQLTDQSSLNNNPEWTPTSGGKESRCREVAAECGCSRSAVRAVLGIDEAVRIGKEWEKKRLVPEPFDPGLTAEQVNSLVDGFPGWQLVFARLNLAVNNYLQIGKVIGDDRPAVWLENIRSVIEKAQRGIEQDQRLRKMGWPNGRPAGSGDFAKMLEPGEPT